MSYMDNKTVKYNIAASLGSQIVIIVSGFILPKIILMYFGSSINGLVASINQFLNYVTLLEGGIASVIMAILYKPLYEKDSRKISQVVNTSTHFFKLLSYIYIGYVIIFALIYPHIVDSPFTYSYTVLLIFVLALNLFFQYFLSVSFRLLLNADRKVAFVSIVQTIVILLNMIGVIVCAYYFKDIIVIKAFSAVVFVLQPVVYHLYVRKKYDINIEDGFDEYTQKHRWDGIGINTAYFIHANTDIVVLSILATLPDVSIYAVYSLIVKALKLLVGSISSAIVPSFGNVLVKGDKDEANTVFDYYEYGTGYITVVIFTCGMLLITPFVDVYTLGVTDANYHQPVFGMLLVLSEMIYCYRDPYVAAAYSAGHIKQVSKYAYLEAFINIVVSVALVPRLGIIGVAIGTILAMFYRMIMQIVYLKDNVLYRPITKAVKSFVILGCSAVIPIILVHFFFEMTVTNYLEWLILAIKIFGLVIGCTTFFSFIFLKQKMMFLITKMKKN